MRQPAYKRHDFYPGSFTEGEKLCTDASGPLFRKVSPVESAGALKGKEQVEAPRDRIPMECRVADRRVVV